MTAADRAFIQPTETHDAFLRWGKALRVTTRLTSRLDLPETLTLVRNRPILFAGNHRSLFDFVATMAIFAKFDMSCRIMLRADYMERGPGAAVLRQIGCIPTSSDLREEAEAEAMAALTRGELVAMMPEGRLIPKDQWVDGVGTSPRPGVSRIARATGAVIMPVAFSGSEVIWPRGGMPQFRIPGIRVRLRVGDPVTFEGDDHPANTQRVMQAISDILVEPVQ